MMTERLLQYIWQFQYFNKKELSTTDGNSLEIIYQGLFNRNQGPDFTAGRIKLATGTWIGNIELHVNSSDWYRHMHDDDPNYNNVILHVVWEDDHKAGTNRFPTLTLSDRVPKVLLEQYRAWMEGNSFIACERLVSSANELVWTNWRDRLMIERLERKSTDIMSLLKQNNFHWEEVMWWMVARNFGLHVNSDAFASIAASIPFNILLKCRNQVQQLEALLLGQAGLLECEFKDKYAIMLKKEYHFLRLKYTLKKIDSRVSFLRMRPACFPTVRLAQLAMYLHRCHDVVSSAFSGFSLAEAMKQLTEVSANDYWHYRFRFDEESDYRPKRLGEVMAANILINTFIPVAYSYGKYHKEKHLQDKAIDWLRQVPVENNSTIKRFRDFGVLAKNAADTQSLLEMKTQYCDNRRCLDCAIGSVLLKRSF